MPDNRKIVYEITEEIAVLSESDKGWTKELNLISWNGKAPQYDIRNWGPDREKVGKGITLTAEELGALIEAVENMEDTDE